MFNVNIRSVFKSAIVASVVGVLVFSYSCSKNNSTTPTTHGTPGISATVGNKGKLTSFNLNSVKYLKGVLTINAEEKGKPDTDEITIVLTAKQYGNYNLSVDSSPNYAKLVIMDHADTVYYTGVFTPGYLQLTSFDTTGGNHVATGSFSFTCAAVTPNIPGGKSDTVTGTFSNLTW